MPLSTLEKILTYIQTNFKYTRDLEVTFEVNPGGLTKEYLQSIHTLGVNRVSLGIQALDNVSLQVLGRDHDTAQARLAMDWTASIFPRFSFDLMYGRPNQTTDSWGQELSALFSYQPRHLSLYQLTIEEDTAFARNPPALPDTDTILALEQLLIEKAATHHLEHYEISSLAVKGEECRHNMGYWQYQPYIGIGPGAHGRVWLEKDYMATVHIRAPEKWRDTVIDKGHGALSMTPLTPRDVVHEYVLSGLRLKQGIDLKRLAEVTTPAWMTYIDISMLNFYTEQGLLTLTADCLKATALGFQKVDGMLAQLLQ
jgi:putative oxygen-independent coproporphyrinogen III oxidase